MEYLDKVLTRGTIKWAIAGRSAEKLQNVKEEMEGDAKDAGIIVAQAGNLDSMREMAKRTK